MGFLKKYFYFQNFSPGSSQGKDNLQSGRHREQVPDAIWRTRRLRLPNCPGGSPSAQTTLQLWRTRQPLFDSFRAARRASLQNQTYCSRRTQGLPQAWRTRQQALDPLFRPDWSEQSGKNSVGWKFIATNFFVFSPIETQALGLPIQKLSMTQR